MKKWVLLFLVVLITAPALAKAQKINDAGKNLPKVHPLLTRETGISKRVIIEYEEGYEPQPMELTFSTIKPKKLRLINSAKATVNKNDLEKISKQPGVKMIWPDFEVKSLLADSVAEINATYYHSIGFNGTGAKIAILDTGIAVDHIDLDGGKVVAGKDFTGSGYWIDDEGHGTHVACIAAGTGEAQVYDPLGGPGVAHDAALLSVKVLDSLGSGYASDVIEGIEWAVDQKADIISLSLGWSPGDPDSKWGFYFTDPLSRAVNAAVENGVVVVAASGNSGPGAGTLGYPSAAEGALTVGAEYNGGVLAFTSFGPTADGRIKPDVVAPGYSIYSCDYLNPLGYTDMSGTSMAAPHVSGLAALVKQKYPHLNSTEVKAVIMAHSRDLGLEVIHQGTGLVNGSIGGFYALPPNIYFGIVAENASSVLDVEFRNLESQSLNITTILSSQANGTAANWVTVNDNSIMLPANGQNSTTLNLTVPEGTQPGFYHGRLIASNDTWSVMIPFSVVVPITINPGSEVKLNNTLVYDVGSILPSNAGDYHYYIVNVTTHLDRLNITLNGTNGDADLYFVHPDLTLASSIGFTSYENILEDDIRPGLYQVQVQYFSGSGPNDYNLTMSAPSQGIGTLNVSVYEVDPSTYEKTGNLDVRQDYGIGINITVNNTDPTTNWTLTQDVFIFELDENGDVKSFNYPWDYLDAWSTGYIVNYGEPYSVNYTVPTSSSNMATDYVVMVHLYNLTKNVYLLRNTTFTLIPRYYNNLTGHVYNVSNNQPLSGVDVLVRYALNDTQCNSTLTDASGGFYFNQSVGIWEIGVGKSGYINYTREENVYLKAAGVPNDSDQLNPQNLVFYMYPEGYGRVLANATNQAGNNVTNISLYCYESGSLASIINVTGGDSFMISGKTNYTFNPVKTGFNGLRNFTNTLVYNGTDFFLNLNLTDTEPPTILNLSLSNTTPEAGDTVYFNANITDNDFVLSAILYSNGTLNTTGNMTKSGIYFNDSRTYITTGNYTTYIVATDNANLMNISGIVNLTVMDWTPPNITHNVSSVNQSQASYIRVNTTDNDQVNIYWVTINLTYPNGTTTTLNNSYPARNYTYFSIPITWSQSGNHTLTILANDSSGNYRLNQTNYTIIDEIPPTISGCSYTPPLGASGTNEEIWCTITDNDVAAGAVTSWVNLTQGSSYNITVLNNTGSTFLGNFTVWGTGLNNLTVYANDTAGNRAYQNLSPITVHQSSNFTYNFTVYNTTAEAKIGWYSNFTSWRLGGRTHERQVPATTLDLGIDLDSGNYAIVVSNNNFSSNRNVEFNATKFSNVQIESNVFVSAFAFGTNLTFSNASVMMWTGTSSNSHLMIYKSVYNFNTSSFYGGWTLACNNTPSSSNPCGRSNHSLGMGSSEAIYVYTNATSFSAYALVIEPYCGDGTCQSTENCGTCSSDCLSSGYVCCSSTRYIGDCCTNSQCSSGKVCTNHACVTSTTTTTGGGGGGGGIGNQTTNQTTTTGNTTTPPPAPPSTGGIGAGTLQEAATLESSLKILEERIDLLLSVMEDVPLETISKLGEARTKIASARLGRDESAARALLNEAQSIISSSQGSIPDVNIVGSRVVESVKNPGFTKGYGLTVVDENITRTAKIVKIIRGTENETRTAFTVRLPIYPDRNFTYFERIPKIVANNVNEITFNYNPNIIEEDPLVAWKFSPQSNPIDIVYYVNKSLDLQTLSSFENAAAVEPVMKCGDSFCDLDETCCEDCGCPAGDCNNVTHQCGTGFAIAGLGQLKLEWYHFLSLVLGLVIIVGLFVYPQLTRHEKRFVWGGTEKEVKSKVAQILKQEERKEVVAKPKQKFVWEGMEKPKVVEIPKEGVEAVLVINKIENDGHWHAVTINQKTYWLFSKLPISFPVFARGGIRKAGDLIYMEVESVSVIDKQEKQNVADVINTLPQTASVQGSCRCTLIDQSGYWYELTDQTGKITLYSKKPMCLYGKFKLIYEENYYLIQNPYLMKSEISRIGF